MKRADNAQFFISLSNLFPHRTQGDGAPKPSGGAMAGVTQPRNPKA
jgi:hypothetical protein